MRGLRVDAGLVTKASCMALQRIFPLRGPLRPESNAEVIAHLPHTASEHLDLPACPQEAG